MKMKPCLRSLQWRFLPEALPPRSPLKNVLVQTNGREGRGEVTVPNYYNFDVIWALKYLKVY